MLVSILVYLCKVLDGHLLLNTMCYVYVTPVWVVANFVGHGVVLYIRSWVSIRGS